MKLRNKQALSGVIMGTLLLLISPGLLHADPFPPGPGNDDTVSLGIFRIYIVPQFRGMIQTWAASPEVDLPTVCSQLTRDGCYDPQTGKLTSPVLFDGNTIIGRSDPHVDGGNDDQIGTPVAVGVSPYQTQVSDGDFKYKPPYPIRGSGFNEVHTAVAEMELAYHGRGKSFTLPFVMVRAGHALGLRKCPGEVESNTGPNLPGKSFFNVYVEVILPNLGPWGKDMVLTNSTALLIVNETVDNLPPTVVYTHENSSAVPVRFAEDNLPLWKQGGLFGYMTLAGHGYDYGPNKAGTGTVDQFLAIMNMYLADPNKGEMPLPKIPTLTEWGMIIFCALLFGWMAWVIVQRRRRATVGM
ncbi:MAG TPA: hypothetical protein VN285_09495 [Candidatus Deferrimicrobium sp.]|nr:hypothetical protein [Candidatus Deferrimicrobium sp.]